MGIFVAQDQERREDEQVRQRRRRDDKTKHQAEKGGNIARAKSGDQNRRHPRCLFSGASDELVQFVYQRSTREGVAHWDF